MLANSKATRYFSGPLMKQNIKANWILALVVALIMCMLTTVINFANSVIDTSGVDDKVQEAQADFYSHLYAIASFDEQTGAKLSYEDFSSAKDHAAYDQVFDMVSKQSENDFSSNKFIEAIKVLEDTDTSMDTYVRQFEYAYALGNTKGCFDGGELTVDDMMKTMLETMGVNPDLVQNLSKMDTTALLNNMYFTVMGLLPIFLFIVIVANALIASQVDSGSMAYVLSTPTKRSAVAITQAVFMIVVPFVILAIVCLSRIVSSKIFFDDPSVKVNLYLYLGMYLLVEAVGALCYMGSCFFNRSSKSMAFGGGLAVWFFLASLLGMFGSDNMVNLGMGVEELDIFNHLTLVGLYDTTAIETLGTASVDDSFLWKFAVLAGIAVVCYVAGFVRFKKKDLPL